MSEYWVSRDKYWCKYCKIFIADDKPSRILHETGLKHKGNYERFIRDIYKRGEKDQKEKAEEAREIARIEAKVKPPPPPPAAADVKTEDRADVKPTEEQAAALALAAERQEEEDRPTQKRWLKEKTLPIGGEEDEWDPTKVAPLKLKRKILTLKEEEEIKEEEERKRKKRKEEEREMRRREKERAKGKGPEVTKEGWQQVEVTEEPMLEFEEPEVKPEEGEEGAGGAGEGDKAEDLKPKVEEEAPKPSGFKKRKMFGAAAARKK
ncbi:hypothetical protein BCR35DRAFT_97119 [Leucosporidium creatinivorum]|uniref:Matrin-type domain-containing protein n=1 Tax=Leucosporidium creatinivorum TaxID=106004 RepID=A0A1Y2F635_9BASI|nr:hypothetical protein BCR35DRAFT_97119 [Leucosporidium creatinivorum]